ncbi:MAG: hypothetical protein ACRDRZ_09255 [Pseudonocardiaceae bacterium]
MGAATTAFEDRDHRYGGGMMRLTRSAAGQHGLDVPGADTDGLHHDHDAALVAVVQEPKPGAAQVDDPPDRFAHADPARWERGRRRAPG